MPSSKPSSEEVAPSEEVCKRLTISDKERILCANEFVLLRALRACLFVRNNLDEKYYLTFRSALLPPVVERMNRNAPHRHHDDPVAALDDYLDDLKSDKHVAFSLTYLNRVYPVTQSSESLFLQGIPVNVGFKLVMITFEKVRDGFSLLLTGKRYETMKGLDEAPGS